MSERDPGRRDEDDQTSTTDAASVAFTPGVQVGRYQLCFELASGGMAKVYLARASGAAGFEKLVALKRIHSHLAERRDFVEMFMDEARIASRISHPNVCTVFDFGSAGRDQFIAMEYLVGETLGRIYRRVAAEPARLSSPVWWATALRMVADACEGLHAAHELRNDAGELLHVIHRDISPANIFVTYDGTVKVVDFGVARANERTHQTSAGQIKGQYAYMAPEHARGKPIDRRADLWSVGVILFELLSGRRMMDYPNDAAILMALLSGEVPSLSEVRPGLPEHVYAIVSRALSMDPAGRPASARELAKELERSILKIGEPVGRGEVEELMRSLFAAEKDRRLALIAKARKMGPGAAEPVPVAEDDSQRLRIEVPDSHVRRAPPITAAVEIPIDAEGELGALEDVPTLVGMLEPRGAPAGEAPSEVSPPTSEPGSGRRNVWLIASAAAVGLLLAVGASTMMGGGATDENGAPAVPTAAGGAHATTLEAAPPPAGAVAEIALHPAEAPAAGAEPGTSVVPPAGPLPFAAPTGAEALVDDAAASDGLGGAEVTADPSVLDEFATEHDEEIEEPTTEGRPARRRPARARPRIATTVGTGTVNIVTPGGWAEIFEGGRRIGRAPGRVELPAGRHTLEIRPFGTGTPHRVSVTVSTGETTRVSEPVTP